GTETSCPAGRAGTCSTGHVGAHQTSTELASRRHSPDTLELGGKPPAVVLPDADLASAVPAVVRSGLVNSGQACNATTRLVLPRARAADATELIARALEGLTPGDPMLPETTFGPLSSARQRDRVLEHLAAAGDSPALTA